MPAWAVIPVRGSELRGAEGPWLRKYHEVETDLAGRRRETTENPQVTQHQYVTRSETLHPLSVLTDHGVISGRCRTGGVYGDVGLEAAERVIRAGLLELGGDAPRCGHGW